MAKRVEVRGDIGCLLGCTRKSDLHKMQKLLNIKKEFKAFSSIDFATIKFCEMDASDFVQMKEQFYKFFVFIKNITFNTEPRGLIEVVYYKTRRLIQVKLFEIIADIMCREDLNQSNVLLPVTYIFDAEFFIRFISTFSYEDSEKKKILFDFLEYLYFETSEFIMQLLNFGINSITDFPRIAQLLQRLIAKQERNPSAKLSGAIMQLLENSIHTLSALNELFVFYAIKDISHRFQWVEFFDTIGKFIQFLMDTFNFKNYQRTATFFVEYDICKLCKTVDVINFLAVEVLTSFAHNLREEDLKCFIQEAVSDDMLKLDKLFFLLLKHENFKKLFTADSLKRLEYVEIIHKKKNREAFCFLGYFKAPPFYPDEFLFHKALSYYEHVTENSLDEALGEFFPKLLANRFLFDKEKVVQSAFEFLTFSSDYGLYEEVSVFSQFHKNRFVFRKGYFSLPLMFSFKMPKNRSDNQIYFKNVHRRLSRYRYILPKKDGKKAFCAFSLPIDDQELFRVSPLALYEMCKEAAYAGESEMTHFFGFQRKNILPFMNRFVDLFSGNVF